MTTSLEYIAVFVVVTLSILSFWMDYRRRKAQAEQAKKTAELQKSLDQLHRTLDHLQDQLHATYPHYEATKN